MKEINDPKVGDTIVFSSKDGRLIPYEIDKICDTTFTLLSLDLKRTINIHINTWNKQKEILNNIGYYG
jgi:hypothetical protein